MSLCKGKSCKKYDAKYTIVYVMNPITDRLDKCTRTVKRSCYNEPGCWRGYVDTFLKIIRTRKELNR